MKKLFILTVLLPVVLSCNRKVRDHSVSANYNYTIECVDKLSDGKIIVKSWGKGLSNNGARDEAYKKALEEVMFKGIRNGSSECNSAPLISAANARQEHNDYFNNFFADRDAYKDYVSLYRKPKLPGSLESDRLYPFEVEVDIPSLKNHLQRDKIINE